MLALVLDVLRIHTAQAQLHTALPAILASNVLLTLLVLSLPLNARVLLLVQHALQILFVPQGSPGLSLIVPPRVVILALASDVPKILIVQAQLLIALRVIHVLHAPATLTAHLQSLFAPILTFASLVLMLLPVFALQDFPLQCLIVPLQGATPVLALNVPKIHSALVQLLTVLRVMLVFNAQAIVIAPQQLLTAPPATSAQHALILLFVRPNTLQLCLIAPLQVLTLVLVLDVSATQIVLQQLHTVQPVTLVYNVLLIALVPPLLQTVQPRIVV